MVRTVGVAFGLSSFFTTARELDLITLRNHAPRFFYRFSDNNNKKNGALRSQTIFGFFISVPDHFRLERRAVSSRMSAICFVACAVEINVAWNLTDTERLSLYYDSAEELGRLACFQCLFFASSKSHFRIEFVGLFSFLREETQKAIDR